MYKIIFVAFMIGISGTTIANDGFYKCPTFPENQSIYESDSDADSDSSVESDPTTLDGC